MKNTGKTFRLIGASSHATNDRQKDDFYATEPKALELLLDLEKFNHNILEPCCGMGHLSEVLKSRNYSVKSFDLIDRGYGEQQDFFQYTEPFDGDIITNPPFKFVEEFVEKSLSIIPNGNRVAFFMGIQFVEGQKRKIFLEKNPIKTIWVSSSRLTCAMDGDFEKYKKSSARCYAWFIWEKGWEGETTIKWFN
jgi:hypothetical protein